MSSYRQNNSSKRDELFGGGSGPSSSSSSNYKRNNATNRDALFGGDRKPAATPRPSPSTTGNNKITTRTSSSSTTATTGFTSTRSRLSSGGGGGGATKLTGSAKLQKLKEAEELTKKAKKSMSKGVFTEADPIGAGMFYKQAADIYKQCGEVRLERLHRINSAQCQMAQDAYSTAASDYTRAAELASISDDLNPDQKREEASKLHNNAANAWRQMGEMGRAGESQMKGAFGLLLSDYDDGDDNNYGGQRFASDRINTSPLMNMDKKALVAIEEAIEAYVPDVLNRYGRYRQTGTSAYVDPNNNDSNSADEDTMNLAKQNMVETSYAHEVLFKAVFTLVSYGEYPSALYASGAASATLERDEYNTISISRAYVTETILTLAMGDVVAAEKYFLNVHLQRNSYLTSRECKLAEDLIRAIKSMDAEELDEVRDPSGDNRAALSNLDVTLRNLVLNLRVSGTAKTKKTKGKPSLSLAPQQQQQRTMGGGGGAIPSAPPMKSPPAAYAPEVTGTAAATASTVKEPNEDRHLDDDELQASLDANFAEMDQLLGEMGLGSYDDGGDTGKDFAKYVDDEDEDDDDIDLR